MKTRLINFAMLSCFSATRTGVAAIEFALIAPVFLLLMLGMTAYGIHFGASHSVQQLAADAARIAIGGTSSAERTMLVARYIDGNASNYAFVERDRLAYTLDEAAGRETLVVSLQYDASALPIWGLLTDLPLPGQTIRRSSTIRTGGT